MGIKKPLIRQAGSAGALIGSTAAGRELNNTITCSPLLSRTILCPASLNGTNEVNNPSPFLQRFSAGNSAIGPQRRTRLGFVAVDPNGT
jgi:hypothetical protein